MSKSPFSSDITGRCTDVTSGLHDRRCEELTESHVHNQSSPTGLAIQFLTIQHLNYTILTSNIQAFNFAMRNSLISMKCSRDHESSINCLVQGTTMRHNSNTNPSNSYPLGAHPLYPSCCPSKNCPSEAPHDKNSGSCRCKKNFTTGRSETF